MWKETAVAAASLIGWPLAAYVLLVSCYMAVIVIGSWCYRIPSRRGAGGFRIVVVVPAHNEQDGIGSTIRGLLGCRYDPAALSVVVIADNCTDDTAGQARSSGAQVLVRTDTLNRGKGQALHWALSTHKEAFANADLVAFVDADMEVDSDFFEAMASVFSDPNVVVAQGRYTVSNPSRGFLSAVGFASFCYVNHVRPAGRGFLGGTADLKGSGMAFRASFLLPRGWTAHSIAEDVQLGKELMLEGVRVIYVPAAKVSSPIPSSLSQVRVQQARWEGGKKEVISSVLPRTIVSLVKRPSALLCDGLLDLLVPPLSVVALLSVVGLAIALFAVSDLAWIFVTSMVVFAVAVGTGLLQNRAPVATYLYLLGAPFFIVWKLGLLLRLTLSAPPKAWNRTPRDAEK